MIVLRALRSIAATDLRAFITKLESTVSSVDYQRGILSELSSILEAAVDDKRLARNPMHAKSVRWPKSPRERRDAWPMDTALRVRDAISERNRIAVVVGLGVRTPPGGGFRTQSRRHRRRARLAARSSPSTGDSRKAVLRLAEGEEDPHGGSAPPSVAEELKRHIEAFPPVEAELPWGQAGEGEDKVLPAAHHALRQRCRGEHMEHLHLEARLGQGGRHPTACRGGESLAVGGGPEGRLPCASAHLRLDHVGGRRVRRDPGSVARTLLARDHSRLLCSLHAGGWQQGARRHRRSARGGARGGISLLVETPQILPALLTRGLGLYAPE